MWIAAELRGLEAVFLLPPKQTFRVRSDGGASQSSVICHLKPEALVKWFDGDLEWTEYRLEAGLDIGDSSLRWLLLRLSSELKNPGVASVAMVELLIAQIALELGRYCVTIQERPTQGALAPWRIRLVEERLRAIDQPPTLAELAEGCSMSVRQLTRAFRVSHGCSIGDYMAQCRIDHAKRMLTSDQSVKSVAYALGFSSPSSFSYAFRSATGLTPREYKCTHAR
jgi:AraC family transcriptional regulator